MEKLNNSYAIAGIILLVAIVGFVLGSKKTEAPEDMPDNVYNMVSGAVADGTYIIDTEKSYLKWTGEFIGGLSETGTVKFNSGEAVAESGFFKTGEFFIDMNTMEDSAGKQRLTDHLKSDDFFSVATYPTSTFVIKTIAPSSEQGLLEGRFVMGGDLTVKGITQAISFITTIKPTQNGAVATASFAINRADWEIKYNSPSFFKNLGDKAIRDAVQIELHLEALKQN
ncbi:MAG: YceI family protein [Patescibacteria group bacterium]